MFVSMTNEKALQIITIGNFLLLFPFAVADLVFAFDFSDNQCGNLVYAGINLKQWMMIDGFIKLVVVLFLIAMNILYRFYQDKERVMFFLGTTLKIYYLFLLAWMSYGSYLFYAYSFVNGNCPNSFGNYVWVIHMAHNVIMPIGLIISGFTGSDYKEIIL